MHTNTAAGNNTIGFARGIGGTKFYLKTLNAPSTPATKRSAPPSTSDAKDGFSPREDLPANGSSARTSLALPMCESRERARPTIFRRDSQAVSSSIFIAAAHTRRPPTPARQAKELRGGLVRRAEGYALRSAHIAEYFEYFELEN